MARFCVPKDKMSKVLAQVKKVGMEELTKLEDKELVKFFEKSLSKSDAEKLALEFMRDKRSIQANALKNFVRRNFDAKYRASMLRASQRRVIHNFLNKSLKGAKGTSEVMSVKDILKMKKKERDTFLDKFFDKEDGKAIKEGLDSVENIKVIDAKIAERNAEAKKSTQILENKIKNYLSKGKKKSAKSTPMKEIAEYDRDKLIKYLKDNGIKDAENVAEDILVEKAKRDVILGEQKLITEAKKIKNRQVQVINNLLKEKPVYRERKTISVDKLVAMSNEERLAFLKTLDSKQGAEELNRIILKHSETPLEKEIKRSLSKDTTFAEMKAKVDGKIQEIVNAKNKLELTDNQFDAIKQYTDEANILKDKYTETGSVKDGEEYFMKLRELNQYVNDIAETEKWYDWGISALLLQRAVQSGFEFSSILIQGGLHLPRVIGEGIIGAMNGNQKSYSKYTQVFDTVFKKESSKAYERQMASIMTKESYKAMQEGNLHLTDVKGGLNKQEEDFVTKLFNKIEKTNIPIVSEIGALGDTSIGRFSRFHSLWLNTIRKERFDQMYMSLKRAGIEMSDEGKKYLATTINDTTGGSKLGNFEQAATNINALLYSVRKAVGDIKSATVRPVKDFGLMFSKDKEIAMIARDSVLTLSTGYGAILGIFGLFKFLENSWGKENISVETNPTSSEFGEVKVGNIRQNIMGSRDWFMTFVARMMSEGYKSSTTGLYAEYGSPEALFKGKPEMMFNTMRGKLSPNASFVVDFVFGENMIGDEFFNGMTAKEWSMLVTGDMSVKDKAWDGVKQEAFNRLVPITYQGLIEAYKENPKVAATMFFPVLGGAGISTYGMKKEWQWEETDEMKKFQEDFGYQKTKEAGDLFDERVEKEWKEFMFSPEFDTLDDEEKRKMLGKIKEKEKKKIFKEYKFYPPK